MLFIFQYFPFPYGLLFLINGGLFFDFSYMNIIWISDICKLEQNLRCLDMEFYMFTFWVKCALQKSLNMIIYLFIISLIFQKVFDNIF